MVDLARTPPNLPTEELDLVVVEVDEVEVELPGVTGEVKLSVGSGEVKLPVGDEEVDEVEVKVSVVSERNPRTFMDR